MAHIITQVIIKHTPVKLLLTLFSSAIVGACQLPNVALDSEPQIKLTQEQYQSANIRSANSQMQTDELRQETNSYNAPDLVSLASENTGLPSFHMDAFIDVIDGSISTFTLSQLTPLSDNDLVTMEIRQEAEIALNIENASQGNSAWTRLHQGLKMTPVLNKRVQAQLKWYLDHPKYLTRTMQRAKPFLPLILDELYAKDLPTEFALLPIVESAFQTFAYSHGRASGMWQIIPSTGRFLGLKQNWWYDGRRDIIESTKAATTYLQSLAKQFDNDWELALAAYNAGPGKIRSAIRYNNKKGRKTDFWHLTRIRAETKNYVPKLLALKEIFANPEKYGIELLPIEDEPGYEVVDIDSQLDLALAADLAGISTEQLYQLNPAFNRWATAPNGPHRLLIPPDSADQFKAELAELPKRDRINWIRHKIKPGETLGHLAVKYRTTTSLIRDINKIRGNQIRAGKYLLVPTATKSLNSYSLSQGSRQKKIKNTERKGTRVSHRVESGDSFWSISRKYGVNTRALAKWNGMAPIDTLKIGQKLVVWQREGQGTAHRVTLHDTSPQSKVHALRYTVRKGDSLSRIAGKFNIRVSDIKKWNKVGRYLQPGQKLKLYVDVTRQSG
jgi:membrane-bound lytic murein transglycosylase D